LAWGDIKYAIPMVLTHTQYIDIRKDFDGPMANLIKVIRESLCLDTTIIPHENHAQTLENDAKVDLESAYDFAYQIQKNQDWPITSLGTLVEIVRAKAYSDGAAQTKGVYPAYGASGIVRYIDEYQYDGNFLLLHASGPNLLTRNSPIIYRVSGKFAVDKSLHVLQTPDTVVADYVLHYIGTLNLSKYVTGFSVPRLNIQTLLEIPIPVPPIDAQLQIVAVANKQMEILEQARNAIQLQLDTIDTLQDVLLRRTIQGDL
jgi:restriction endonuclease S subunit